MKKLIFGTVFMLLVSNTVLADDSSRAARGNSTVGIDIGYAPVSLPFPSTKAASVYFVLNPDWQIGFEYAWTTFG